MRIKTKVLASLAAFALIFSFAFADSGGDRLRRSRMGHEATLPLEANALPYDGYGEVDIVENGTIAIKVNGATFVNQETGDFIVQEEDVLLYQVDTTNLRIVESHGSVFLDRAGRGIRQRGLRSDEVVITPFERLQNKGAGGARKAIETFIGDLQLDFSPADGVLSLHIIDRQTAGREFDLIAPIARYAPQAQKGGFETPDVGNDPQIVLEDPPQQVECSATCSKGSCSISCQGKPCTAYCRGGGYPVCYCGQSN
jgi:hypothetical protein